jgi:hypothetical protein
MSEGPDLVRLLYRADWTRLGLAAEVNVSEDPSLDQSQFPGGCRPRRRPECGRGPGRRAGPGAGPFPGGPGNPR